MRAAALLLLAASVAPSQFKSTVPLVVAPTTVTDAKGKFIDGLGARDLRLYDNNVPQAIQVDTFIRPISLAVVVQASANSSAILDKVGGSGVLFADLLSGDKGETALIAAATDVRVLQDFTSDSAPLSLALKDLRVQGERAAVLDGVARGLQMLEARGMDRRRVMLVIAERRDRSSKTKLAQLLGQAQLQNTAIYWLYYSPFLAAFTNRPKTKWDRMTEKEKEQKARERGHRFPDPEDEELAPPDMAPGSWLSIFTELKHRAEPDAAGMLSAATGGRTLKFLKRSGLEEAIQAVGEEVHRQYMVSFQPAPDGPGKFHALRAEVTGRPELAARTRAGYWSVE